MRPQDWPWWLSIAEALKKAAAGESGPRHKPATIQRPAGDLRALGALLERIALGDDATHAFEQDPPLGRDSRKYQLDHSCVLYWKFRNDGASQADAAKKALELWPKREGPAPAIRMLVKRAGTHKEHMLDAVEQRSYTINSSGKPVVRILGKSADKLRATIAKRSRKGNGA